MHFSYLKVTFIRYNLCIIYTKNVGVPKEYRKSHRFQYVLDPKTIPHLFFIAHPSDALKKSVEKTLL